ncbi:uncharacterized protein LOC111029154 isoform X2 [Myzus persicae]|uniref:uncharacterized protein LOC111029154 isoform X2 n=1 Tax=Myzus persicae TaxID=13164 RepID=UPI000B930826|nr:uncharacterized protein LOC111029154 isoform X2 [Myzus persicae]
MICVRRSNKLYSTVVGSSSLKQTPSRFSFPERFRGTIVERWKQYWESVAKDYYESTVGIGTYARANPIKSSLAAVTASFIWIDEFNDDIQAYKANCKYLKPSIFSIHQRAVDIGFLNVWWSLKKIMVDYDVNPEEWKDYKEPA